MLQKRKEMMDLNEKKKKVAHCCCPIRMPPPIPRLCRKQEAESKGETFVDDLAKKQKDYWGTYKNFPLKAKYDEAVKKDGPESKQAKDLLLQRCVFALKKVLEHQQVSSELVPAKKANLVTDDEWKVAFTNLTHKRTHAHTRPPPTTSQSLLRRVASHSNQTRTSTNLEFWWKSSARK